MRVKTERIGRSRFAPFKLVFTIETKKEAELFHNLFNYKSICELFEEKTTLTAAQVREVLEQEVKCVELINWEEFIAYFERK